MCLEVSGQWLLCNLGSRMIQRAVMWDPPGEAVHLLRHHRQLTVQTYVLYYDNQDQDLYDLLQQWQDTWTDGNILVQHLRHRRDYRLGMLLCQKYQEDKHGHHQLR